MYQRRICCCSHSSHNRNGPIGRCKMLLLPLQIVVVVAGVFPGTSVRQFTRSSNKHILCTTAIGFDWFGRSTPSTTFSKQVQSLIILNKHDWGPQELVLVYCFLEFSVALPSRYSSRWMMLCLIPPSHSLVWLKFFGFSPFFTFFFLHFLEFPLGVICCCWIGHDFRDECLSSILVG